MGQTKFSNTSSYRDWEYGSWMPDVDDNTARRVVVDGRSSSPTAADVFNAFNPLAMPLKTWTRLIELPAESATVDYPQGWYFINDSFIQFFVQINDNNPYDMEIVENNILLLSDNIALELDATDGISPFAFTSDIFLELE